MLDAVDPSSRWTAGTGSASPPMAAPRADTASVRPAAKSPSLNLGVMRSTITRLATTSGIAPSSPRPTSMRSGTIVLGDDDDGTIVDLPASDLPRLCQSDAELLDGLRLRRRQQQDRHLRTLVVFDLLQRRVQRCHLLGRQRGRQVGHARRQLRDRERFRRAIPETVQTKQQRTSQRRSIGLLAGGRRVELDGRRRRDCLLVLDREVRLGLPAHDRSPSGCWGRCARKRCSPVPTGYTGCAQR